MVDSNSAILDSVYNFNAAVPKILLMYAELPRCIFHFPPRLGQKRRFFAKWPEIHFNFYGCSILHLYMTKNASFFTKWPQIHFKFYGCSILHLYMTKKSSFFTKWPQVHLKSIHVSKYAQFYTSPLRKLPTVWKARRKVALIAPWLYDVHYTCSYVFRWAPVRPSPLLNFDHFESCDVAFTFNSPFQNRPFRLAWCSRLHLAFALKNEQNLPI